MKILLTSTSFQDTPGKHQDLLDGQGFKIDKLRGPVTEEVLLPIIQNYDAVICGDDEYTENVIKKGRDGKLKYISKYGVGLDRIDLEAAKKYGVPVTNCPGVNQVSVSEHVLALLFAFEKNVHLQYNSTNQGSWKRLVGHEIEGRTIGIVGLGAVGKELAKKSSALGMSVLGYDLYKDKNFLEKYEEIKFVDDINLIYQNADIISLHIPHTPESENLINEDVINNRLGNNPIIINTSRGMLVDSKAILNGLEEGKLRGYLTDVLSQEPIEQNEILMGKENVIITPHVGSRTFESVERQGIMAVNNLINMVEGNLV
ncbi:phosphoglycerate dehydrogenase [Zhouia amylolytica]|uniref:phosphoglycerate dehydrogenase n=1 Tax=Zhouia amylolytica TaxID=376730 RepID=UPI0020CF9849|nr:phosphoglycerate dehydrogenase [Zhouia amylolytica]MCQ0113110.1 phosphoglycerate dehydrogenase [Zhouia amylolytica]